MTIIQLRTNQTFLKVYWPKTKKTTGAKALYELAVGRGHVRGIARTSFFLFFLPLFASGLPLAGVPSIYDVFICGLPFFFSVSVMRGLLLFC